MSAAWRWLGHFSVLIEGPDGRLFVDPYRLRPKKLPRADAVLVTNPRVGHCSPEDVAAIAAPGCRAHGPEDALALLGVPGEPMSPGDEREVVGLRVRAVRAYSVGRSFFPRERGWLGFVIEREGETLWHAGATDRIPEMAEIRADVACVPISGRYVMDADEARAAADDAGARVRVPLLLAGDRYSRTPGFTVGPEGS